MSYFLFGLPVLKKTQTNYKSFETNIFLKP